MPKIDQPPDRLRALQAACEALDSMEPVDLDHRPTQQAVRDLQELSSQLIWCRDLGRPEFRT